LKVKTGRKLGENWEKSRSKVGRKVGRKVEREIERKIRKTKFVKYRMCNDEVFLLYFEISE